MQVGPLFQGSQETASKQQKSIRDLKKKKLFSKIWRKIWSFGYSDVGDFFDSVNCKMLVMRTYYWWLFRRFCCNESVTKSCHQLILSPTSVANIDSAEVYRLIFDGDHNVIEIGVEWVIFSLIVINFLPSQINRTRWISADGKNFHYQ